MSIKERRRREVASRESLILSTARDMLARDGYLGLSMDRLAEAIEYSKPTIYQHFATKEDLILAVANEALAKRAELFTRASRFHGRSRETMTAIGAADAVFVNTYRDYFAIEQMLHESSLWEKSTPERRQAHETCGYACMNAMQAILFRAVSEGDLDPRHHNPEDLVWGLRNLSVGTHTLAMSRPWPEAQLVALYRGLFRNQHALLDGAGWRPLYTEWDYAATFRRALREVFPNEPAHPVSLLGLPA